MFASRRPFDYTKSSILKRKRIICSKTKELADVNNRFYYLLPVYRKNKTRIQKKKMFNKLFVIAQIIKNINILIILNYLKWKKNAVINAF